MNNLILSIEKTLYKLAHATEQQFTRWFCAALPPGTRRQWATGIHEKQPDGSWVKVTEPKERPEEAEKPKNNKKSKDFEVIGKDGYKDFVDSEYKYLTGILTKDEKESIGKYGGYGFERINNDLRKGKENFYANDIKEVFKKLKPLSKNVQMFRGMKISTDTFETIKQNSVISDKSFTSISSNPGMALQFTKMRLEDKGKVNVVIKINVPKGSKMLNMKNPLEQEFLLNTGSKLRVGNIRKSKDDKFYIVESNYEQ